MGFFSKTCAKTHLPIVTMYKDGYPALSEVVALLPDGQVVRGLYDGYGRVAGEDLVHGKRGGWQWPKVKMVLAKNYNGETYNELPRSGDELAQGYFMSNEFLDYCLEVGSFKTRGEYVKAFNKLANWI